jgi:hypothetical protein
VCKRGREKSLAAGREGNNANNQQTMMAIY